MFLLVGKSFFYCYSLQQVSLFFGSSTPIDPSNFLLLLDVHLTSVFFEKFWIYIYEVTKGFSF